MVLSRLWRWLEQQEQNKRPAARAPRSVRGSRVRLEQLEERLAPALVDWVCNDGDWASTSCWSSGTLPTAVDDVVINRPGTITVTNSLQSTTIRSLQNFETLALTSGVGAYTTRLNVTGGTLTNEPGGTISTLGGGSRNLDATLNNMGTLSLGAGLNLLNGMRVFESHLGSIDVAAGQTFAVKGEGLGYVTLGSPTNLTGGGKLDLTGGTIVVLVTDFTLNPGPTLELSDAVTVDGPGRFINNSTLRLTDDIITADVVNNGTLAALGSSNEISGTYTMGPTALLQVQVSRSHGDADIRFTRNFTNGNRIELTSVLADGNATLTMDGATLLNPLGSTIFVGGDNGARTIAGSVTNEGTLELVRSLTVANTGTTFRNETGRIRFIQTSVELTLFGGNSVMGDPQTLFVGDNTNRLNLASVHTMSISSTFFFLAATGPRLRLVGRVTINGPGTLVNQIPLELTGDIINATLDNQNNVVAWGAGNEINGGYGAAPGSGIIIQGRDPCNAEFGPMSCGDADLLIGRDFINNGPITLTSIDDVYSAQLIMPVGTTLTNVSTITASEGTGGDRLVHAQIVNRGNILGDATAGLTVYGTNAVHVNEAAGVLDATLMSMFFNSGTSLHNLGLIDVGASLTFSLSGMSLVNYNSGTHTLTGGRFQMTNGTIEFPDGDIEVNLADISLTGINAAMVNNAGPPVSALTNFRENDRNAQNVGRFAVQGNVNWEILGNFTNDGILVIDSSSEFSIRTGDLVNFMGGVLGGTGVYDISGTLRFRGAAIAQNNATLILSTAQWMIVDENNNDALQPSVTSNGGSITVQNGATLILGAFSNANLIVVGNTGTIRTTANYTQVSTGILRMAGGMFELNAGLVFDNQASARIEGNGTIQSTTLQNAGIVAPGTGTAFNQLTFKGDYAQTSTGRIRIKVNQAGAFDQFTIAEISTGVGGDADFGGGALDVVVIGPDPTPGTTFVAIGFQSRSGSMFGSVTGGYTALYNTNDVTIRKN